MFSNHHSFAILAAVALLCAGGAEAQTPAPDGAGRPADAQGTTQTTPAAAPAPAAAQATPPAGAAGDAKPDLATLQAAARAAEAKLPTPAAQTHAYFDLAPAQRERWQQFLPRTLERLDRREPVQILVLGDAIMETGTKEPAPDGDPLLQSFAGVFAKSLANQFYYTGGVRVLRAGSKLRSKESMVLGPEIQLRPVFTSSIVSAASALATAGFQGRPHMVLLAHGLTDGVRGTPLADVHAALRGVRDQARAQGAELIVAGPILEVAEPEETSLALTRGVSSLMRGFCTAEKLLFSDLGDLSRLVQPAADASQAHLQFPAVVQQYESFLSPAAAGKIALPSALMHDVLGRILFEDVMHGAPVMPWRLGTPAASLQGQGKMTLEFEISNTLTDELRLTMLPLVPPGFRLKDANHVELRLPPNGATTAVVDYALTDTQHLPLKDGRVRLPVLFIAGKTARIEELVAPLQPFSAGWNVRTAFNVEKEFNPEAEIENSSGKALSAAWEATWAGKKQDGKASLDASGAELLKLTLPMPLDEKAPFRQRQPLNFAVSAGNTRQIFDRYVELVRNFGLKEAVPLTAADSQASGVTLRADADSMKLFLTIDLGGVDLVDDAQGRGYELLLNLDARSYGQRLTPGATAALRITGKAADGEAQVHDIAPWAFGNGYASMFDPSEIGATLTSSPSGARRITLMVPKSYLYLHEWALGNGNSELGINVRLNGGGRDYFLTRSTRHPDDAEGLAVLELTDKPTRRWTVHLE